MITKKNTTDFRLDLDWKPGYAKSAEIQYATDKSGMFKAILQILPDKVCCILRTADGDHVLKCEDAALDNGITILKRGNYMRALFGGKELWLQGGTGEWAGNYMQRENDLIISCEDGSLSRCDYYPLSWLKPADAPAIAAGMEGSYMEQQVLPGAILEDNGKYYMYTMCGLKGEEEGSSYRQVGLAVSDDLEHWEVGAEPLIKIGDLNIPHDNLYVDGCLRRDDGKIVLLMTVQVFPKWVGMCAFLADQPEGPFTAYEGNPIIKPDVIFHEFDVVKCDLPQGKYMLYLSRFCAGQGDRGVRYFSNDMLSWKKDEDESTMLKPQTENGWDSIHVRPRSITRIGDYWYFFYEGTNRWKPELYNQTTNGFVNQEWWDTIGLARTTNFHDWEYYPMNPCLNPRGISVEQFDGRWTGWPRMVIKDGTCYIFYSASGEKVNVGLRKVALAGLIDWNSELSERESLI